MNDVTISESDLYEIRFRCGGKPESIEALTREETSLLKQIRTGNKQGFRITVWEMEGDIDAKKFMENAEQLALKRPELRSNILFGGLSKPIRVVSSKPRPLLQMVNLEGIANKQKILVMQNVLAAQARRRYDPQTDSVLKMVGFLTDSRHMILLFSVYPHLLPGIGPQDILSFVFTGMKVTHGRLDNVNDKKVEKLNRDLKAACMEHWEKEILPVGDPVVFSGQPAKNAERREGSLYKGFPAQLNEKLQAFREEQKCTGKAIFLAAWGELFGRQHGMDEPVLWVCGRGELLQLFPVKIRRKLPGKERIKDIDRQLAEAARYSACTFEELCGSLEIREEYFQIIFQYAEFQDEGREDDILSEIMDVPDICSTAMTVSSFLFGGETKINYIYEQDCFYHTTVKKLHEVFLRLLEEQICEEEKPFNLREYIEFEKDTDEKRHKLLTAQKALYLKETGLFEKRSTEELMALAEKAQLGQYSMGDVLLTERQPVCACGFLAEGNVEESRIGADGIVKSISVKKNGDGFALEALFEGNITPFTYSVASEEARILWIEHRDMIAFLNEEPENWRALLEASVREAERMKRLWTMM